jgi:hypothetical protein
MAKTAGQPFWGQVNNLILNNIKYAILQYSSMIPYSADANSVFPVCVWPV